MTPRPPLRDGNGQTNRALCPYPQEDHPKRIRTLIIASVTLTFTATAAPAATVYTPSLSAEGRGSGSFTCHAVNVSTKDREITIDILEASRAVASTLGPTILAAGSSIPLVSLHVNRRYCRVTVKGGKKTIRVSLESRIDFDTVAAVQGF